MSMTDVLRRYGRWRSIDSARHEDFIFTIEADAGLQRRVDAHFRAASL